MMRRPLFILVFLAFIAGVVWYVLAYVNVPQMTFAEAAKVDDHKKKIMVVGKVLPKGLNGQDASTFYMMDEEGAEAKVTLDGGDQFTPGLLRDAAESGRQVSVAGHSHGDYFHASDIFFPSN